MTGLGPLFDRAQRRRLRTRAARGFAAHAFLKTHAAAEVAARLAALVSIPPGRVLDLGSHDGQLAQRIEAALVVRLDPAPAFLAPPLAVAADEDRLPFAPACFDAVVSALSLSGVDDLPGALAQIRGCLRPGGAFVAAMLGGHSLGALRIALLGAEAALMDGVSARIAPTVAADMAPALLQHAGFTDIVTDSEQLVVRYGSLVAALHDLRGMGEGNYLAQRPRTPMPRALLAEAERRFAAQADADGRVAVAVELLYLAGRRPL